MHEERDNHLVADRDFVLWALIRQTEWVIFRAREAELSPYGLTFEQTAVCFFNFLAGNNPTPGELAWWVTREPHTLSGILGRMGKKGLVRKVKDTERKNRVRIVLTEKGRRALE